MPTTAVPFSARLPRSVVEGLKGFARRQGISASAAAARILEESLRMDRHPGIDFRTTKTGRRAFVTGTGLAVWELEMIRAHHRGDRKAVLRGYPGLTEAQMEAAARYAEDCPAEIREDLERAQPRDVRKAYPFLTRVAV
ncbi:MAG: hypothetical protein AAB215_01270 [Planctomycetota bacterium]